jgi:hypothetical protein
VRAVGRRRVRRRSGALGGALLVCLGATNAGFPASARATAALGGFSASAAADGGHVIFSAPGYLALDPIIDGGAPIAQSVLDGQGGKSFASLPYPGGTVVAYQGLVAIALGSAPPIPYPAYVSASYPASPSQSVASPDGYSLTAVASDSVANADGRFRPGDAGGTEATTTATVNGDTVTVDARTRNEAVSIPGLGTIGSVLSRSTTLYHAGDPKPTTTTSLLIEGFKVGNQDFTYGPDGLHVAGSAIPLPSTAATSQLNTALAPAGYRATFLAAQPTAGGAVAAVLELTGHPPLPPPLPRASTVTFRLGGATTSLVLGTSGPSGSASQSPGAITARENGPAGPSQTPTGSASAAGAPSGGQDSALAPLTMPQSVGSTRAARPNLSVPGQPVSIEPVVERGARFFYLILIIGVLLLLGGMAVWRAKGVMRL